MFHVQPSVRKKQLGVDVELTNVTKSGPVQLVASLLDGKGKEEKRFTQTVTSRPRPRSALKLFGRGRTRVCGTGSAQPLHLTLSTKGAGVDDEPAARFGFREVWTQGRDVFMNGTPFRIRPTLMGGAAGGADALREARELGYNFGEQWPGNVEDRSQDARHTDWYDIADRAGFPLSGIMPHMGWMGGSINSPAKVAAYRANTERLMRRYRNHPSIIIWGTSGNMMGGSRDPRYVGLREASIASETQRNSQSVRVIPMAEQGVAIIKSLDPTRPVLIHNGGPAGDFFTLNNYLNFIPLQEREEWLSSYVQKGDMPLMYVEFGTPVSLTLARARNGFTNAIVSEMFLSEYVASYLGDEAYKLEPADYRRRSAELFQKDQLYGSTHGLRERDYAPAWLQLQDLFIRNTWRSWRTMGITGGMVPWDRAYVKLDGKLTAAW
jgi:beta-galactosidase